jgi:hypothetical protein
LTRIGEILVLIFKLKRKKNRGEEEEQKELGIGEGATRCSTVRKNATFGGRSSS